MQQLSSEVTTPNESSPPKADVFTSACEQAPFGIVICSENGKIISANPSACKMLNIPQTPENNGRKLLDNITIKREIRENEEKDSDSPSSLLCLESQQPDGTAVQIDLRIAKFEENIIAYIRDRTYESIQEGLATIDSLTHLTNNRGMRNELRKEISLSLRKRRSNKEDGLIVAMLDLDRFKLFNDTYGHAMGDKALRLFAKILEKNIRDTDIAARYGGEEFTAIFPDLKDIDIDTIANRLITAIRNNFHIQVSEDEKISLTASIGLASLPEQIDADALLNDPQLEFSSLEEVYDCIGNYLLQRADAELYKSKENGRDQLKKCETSLDDLRKFAKETTAERLEKKTV